MVFGELGETLELLIVSAVFVAGLLILIWIQRTTSR